MFYFPFLQNSMAEVNTNEATMDVGTECTSTNKTFMIEIEKKDCSETVVN
jgi:hypothetical protein